MTQPKIDELRNQLMATLASLRDKTDPMEPDRARAIAQVAGVLVDTARVEVEYIKTVGGTGSNFLDADIAAPSLPAPGDQPSANNPFPVVTRHRLGG